MSEVNSISGSPFFDCFKAHNPERLSVDADGCGLRLYSSVHENRKFTSLMTDRLIELIRLYRLAL